MENGSSHELGLSIGKRQESLHSERFQGVVRSQSKLLPRLLRRDEQIEDIPSEISGDEWGEVVKYQKVLDNEQKQREKAQLLSKQRQVKQTLDQ